MRSLIISCVLMALAGGVMAAGEYQRTKNGRTTIWNSNPKPGDSATWNGGRDRDGYADGFGTLTWYAAKEGSKPVVYGIYYGNMVRGKFEGPVNVHVKDKTAHAEFTDGTRTSRWARGTTASWKAKAPIAPEKENVQRPAPNTVKTETGQAAQRSTTEGPVEKPSPAESKIRPEAAHDEPARQEAENPEHRTPNAEHPTTAAAADAPVENAEPPAEKPVPSPAPSRHQAAQSPAGKTPKQKVKFDDSLRALVGPPSSLRVKSTPEPSAATASSAPTAAPEPSAAPQAAEAARPRAAELSEADVIDLADTEATAQGYDLGNYRSPKVDYSKAKDRWSVFYDAKTPDAEGVARPLIVAVEDKTKKALVTSRK